MKVLCVLTAFFLLAFTSHAQQPVPNDTLVGLIVNKSGKAIKNVPVSVIGKKDLIYSNRKGIFLVVGEHIPDTITVMLPSKKLFQIPVGGVKFLKISTNETACLVSQAKDEIVNIGYGNILKSRSTSGNFTITGDELQQTGERDIIMAIA